MKTTIDIPDEMMKDALRITKASTKRDAVLALMKDSIRRERIKKMLSRIGQSTTIMTQEDLMDMRFERGKWGKPNVSR